jgi:hypothetical protein
MSKIFAPVLAAAVAVAGYTVSGHEAYADDKAVCYKVLNKRYEDTGKRLFLNIKRHSPLARGEWSYSVHGKYVSDCKDDDDSDKYNDYHSPKVEDMVTTTGTVVTKYPPYKGYPGETGARLGLITHGGLHGCPKKVSIDCTNKEVDATPDAWAECVIGRKEVSLKETDDKRDDGCNVFQDGDDRKPPY